MTGDILKDSAEIFANIQEKAPVVHNISNYITATDCANMTLACGGSPTMADDPDEVEEIAAACAGSVINMGNTAGHYQESMLRTGMVNNKVDHPLVGAVGPLVDGKGDDGCREMQCWKIYWIKFIFQ